MIKLADVGVLSYVTCSFPTDTDTCNHLRITFKMYAKCWNVRAYTSIDVDIGTN